MAYRVQLSLVSPLHLRPTPKQKKISSLNGLGQDHIQNKRLDRSENLASQ